MPVLAERGELMIYRHTGFWQSMNTMKDTMMLKKYGQNTRLESLGITKTCTIIITIYKIPVSQHRVERNSEQFLER